MANFGETRFLGLTPRAIGLSVVAIAIVVGLFFIPEGVKFLFDAKPKANREQPTAPQASKVAPARKAPESSARAALSRDALSSINADVSGKKASSEQSVEIQKVSKRVTESEETSSGSKGGIFSGWDFSVKARSPSGGRADAPSSLSFEKIISRDGVSFFKQGRSAIPRFLKQEGLIGGPAEEGIQPLREEIDTIVAGVSKGTSTQAVADRLRAAHISALKGLRAAGADRGVMLRWLEVPVVKFIDTKGGANAGRRFREMFSPGLVLNDLSVKQRRQRGWGSSGRSPTNFRAEFSIMGTDVQRVVAYSNGKKLRTVKINRAQVGEPYVLRLNGDAAGVLTVVAYDSFGARPYAKSYSFYPKVTVFRQGRDGTFQIGFLPGSSRNSLDRFFLVGATGRRQPSDSVISTF